MNTGDYFIPESKSESSQDCKLRYETGDTQWELINDDIEVRSVAHIFLFY